MTRGPRWRDDVMFWVGWAFGGLASVFVYGVAALVVKSHMVIVVGYAVATLLPIGFGRRLAKKRQRRDQRMVEEFDRHWQDDGR
jgi:Flp pilus assembly protein TadB